MHLKKIKIFFFFFLFFQYFSFICASELKFGSVIIKNKSFLFNVEIADTKEKREKGLMFRSVLEEGEGLLFVLPKPYFANIWMKNTVLSLDIIFISEDNIIVDLLKEALPLSEEIYSSRMKTKYILEINSGLIEKLGIVIGDEVHIEYE